MEDKNPIAASIDWLIDQGFDRKQATNICKAIKADSPDKTTVQIGPGGVENDLRMRLMDGVDSSQVNPNMA